MTTTTTAELIEQVRKLRRICELSPDNDPEFFDVHDAAMEMNTTALITALERLQKMEQKAATDELTRMAQEDGLH